MFIKWLSDSILPSNKKSEIWLSDTWSPLIRGPKSDYRILYCFYKKLRMMIIEYKYAIDKKFINWLSDTILPSTRNSESGLSDTRLVLMRSS